MGVFLHSRHAGMKRSGLPHARGGVSDTTNQPTYPRGPSPRPWGCFRGERGPAGADGAFPTPVGVFLRPDLMHGAGSGLPHARGGVSYDLLPDLLALQPSPRPWGCFPSAQCGQHFLTSSPPLMAGIPSTGRPCPTASACADSFSKAPTSRTPMRDGESPDISVLGSNCLMAKEEFGTVVATEGSLPPDRPSRPVRSDLGLNPEACRSIWVKPANRLNEVLRNIAEHTATYLAEYRRLNP